VGVSSGYASCMFAGRCGTLILTLGRLARGVVDPEKTRRVSLALFTLFVGSLFTDCHPSRPPRNISYSIQANNWTTYAIG